MNPGISVAGEMTCSDCDAPITVQSKTGRCRPCAMARMGETYTTERRRAAIQKRLSDPIQMKRQQQQIVQAGAEARKDPAFMARLSEIGRENMKAAFTPEARAKWRASRPRANRKRSDTMLAWCPPRLRDEYRKLLKRGNMRAATARAAIEVKITPFDRQLMKVRAGAGIIERRPIPTRQYDCTLGGGSPL